jgi:hypothetical protein
MKGNCRWFDVELSGRGMRRKEKPTHWAVSDAPVNPS